MGVEIKPREQCPQCAEQGRDTSEDNLAIYADGKFCQAGCGYSERQETTKKPTELIAGSIVELIDRKISFATCEKYNVRVTEFTGKLAGNDLVKELVSIFPIYHKGRVVKQKIKSRRDKDIQAQRGDTKVMELFGQGGFSPTKNLPILITEGEEDAMSAFQMTKIPSVSISNGATGSEKQVLANLEWLSGWKEVLLCFDNDEVGREAVEKYIGFFEPGTVKNITLPLKDANDMLKAGREEEFKKAIYTAEIIKPTTIVFPSELREAILRRPPYGSPWPWDFMTKVTYGNRLGEVYMLAADSSIGKTQIVYQIVTQHINDGGRVGLIDLERQPEQTIQRLISGLVLKKIYLPDCVDFDAEEVNREIDKLEDRIALYRPASGKLTIDSILVNIRYLAKAFKMTFFVVDNLTALSTNLAQGSKEHEFASFATGQFVQLAKELNVTIFLINHLTKASVQLQADITMPEEFKYNTNKEGLTWETGRMPEMGHIYGGGKVCKLPDYVMVASRNRMSDEDKVQRTINIKFLKTRFESEFEGKIFSVIYDRATGRLNEVYKRATGDNEHDIT